MKTLLICHAESDFDREGLARWLSGFSELVGIVMIEEAGGSTKRRLKSELKRVGWLRLLDVAAFRLFQRLFLARSDAELERADVARVVAAYPFLPDGLPRVVVSNPNSAATKEFVAALAPDVIVARCKVILKPSVFELARTGTFVMHPGVCPEYRNSHGCFWALANDDLERVGMTLLKIDRGVDTGPVYGYFSYAFDEVNETHTTIQRRVVSENLESLAQRLAAVHAGGVEPIDTSGRASAVWGQPWLTAYLRWKRRAKARLAARQGGAA